MNLHDLYVMNLRLCYNTLSIILAEVKFSPQKMGMGRPKTLTTDMQSEINAQVSETQNKPEGRKIKNRIRNCTLSRIRKRNHSCSIPDTYSLPLSRIHNRYSYLYLGGDSAIGSEQTKPSKTPSRLRNAALIARRAAIRFCRLGDRTAQIEARGKLFPSL